MMNQSEPKTRSSRIEIQSALAIGAMALGVMAMASVTLTGCASEEEQPVARQQVAPPPPPPPPKPVVKSVQELMDEMRIDERVVLPEENAPPTTEDRRAVLAFFDAFARGDHRALADMLDEFERRELERMVESGQWDRATSNIEEVWIRQTANTGRGKAALAVYLVDGKDEVQLWYYTGRDDQYSFQAAPSAPNMIGRLSGTDWIAAWHAIIEGDLRLAESVDESFEQVREVLDDDDESGSSGARPPVGMPSPGTPTRPTGPPPPRRLPSRGTPGG